MTANIVAACMRGSREKGTWSSDPHTGTSQVAIGFLKNTSMDPDPLEKQLDPRRSVCPSVEYVEGYKNCFIQVHIST